MHESRLEHWYNWAKTECEPRIVELLESLDPSFAHHYEYRVSNGDRTNVARRMECQGWQQSWHWRSTPVVILCYAKIAY